MSDRSRIFIRAVVTITGDVAIGTALAAGCFWVIEAAALGLFLSFLLWVLAALLSLAASQYVVHPAASVLLSDRKLDHGLAVLSSAADAATGAAQRLWRLARLDRRYA